MSSNIFLILLVILNLSTFLFGRCYSISIHRLISIRYISFIYLAYRIGGNEEPSQALFRKLKDSANDEERLMNLYNLKRVFEQDQNPDNYYVAPCYPTSSHILCNRIDHLSRRDTGFLRFGRKR
jgi:hypothetical protein